MSIIYLYPSVDFVAGKIIAIPLIQSTDWLETSCFLLCFEIDVLHHYISHFLSAIKIKVR